MDNAADIIQTALDIINSQDREVELVIKDDREPVTGFAGARWPVWNSPGRSPT